MEKAPAGSERGRLNKGLSCSSPMRVSGPRRLIEGDQQRRLTNTNPRPSGACPAFRGRFERSPFSMRIDPAISQWPSRGRPHCHSSKRTAGAPSPVRYPRAGRCSNPVPVGRKNLIRDFLSNRILVFLAHGRRELVSPRRNGASNGRVGCSADDQGVPLGHSCREQKPVELLLNRMGWNTPAAVIKSGRDW
jgi:hypothetical protein